MYRGCVVGESRVWETQLYHTVSGVLNEILAYTMCPNVLSRGTQDRARSAIRSTDMTGNVIELHSYIYSFTYKLFFSNL